MLKYKYSFSTSNGELVLITFDFDIKEIEIIPIDFGMYLHPPVRSDYPHDPEGGKCVEALIFLACLGLDPCWVDDWRYRVTAENIEAIVSNLNHVIWKGYLP